MSWTILQGHRPTGPVFLEIHDNQHMPRQKCSCGSWYCIEHITKVADDSGRVDESEDSLF
jgi:hypothetical protein